ncbi:class I SAM-dependent methyltransferase [Nodularia spumigena]|uniref:class I SAM-dependent methyltransferase n=1 Tax=Nodularia spumigena TaxID=70799 RepID=UPI002B1EDA38|nr:methyltransferase domain-containing protein [Nodularia spumigena]MEA5559073.1 methyltransferase domain-containing protein [Nodularia spumigena CH309]
MNPEYISFIARANQGNPSPGGLALLRQSLSGLPPQKKGAKVLEIGVNTGASFIALAEMLPQCELIGIDIDVNMVEAASRNYRESVELLGLSHGNRLEKADATELPYPNESFDLVVSGGTLSFIADKERAIQEIYRILKPSGFFLSIEYFKKEASTVDSTRVNDILGFDVSITTLSYWMKIHSVFSFEGIHLSEPFVHRAFEPGTKKELVKASMERFGETVSEDDLQKMDTFCEAFREHEPSTNLLVLTLRKIEGTSILANACN